MASFNIALITSLGIPQPLKNEMSRRGLFFELVELKAKGKKEHRVRELVYYYRQGLVLHNKMCCGPLEMQLLSFPASKRWDIMDAFAYICPLLEHGERYFMNMSIDRDESKYFDELEREDEEIDKYEIAIDSEDWRIV